VRVQTITRLILLLTGLSGCDCRSVKTVAVGGNPPVAAGGGGDSGDGGEGGVGGGGGEGGTAACEALITCPPGERCGYDRLVGCGAAPVCRKTVTPCFDAGAACSCSSNILVNDDCETGLFAEPAEIEGGLDCPQGP